jgi:hypothetical protein
MDCLPFITFLWLIIGLHVTFLPNIHKEVTKYSKIKISLAIDSSWLYQPLLLQASKTLTVHIFDNL